jgi:hypothetical protein
MTTKRIVVGLILIWAVLIVVMASRREKEQPLTPEEGRALCALVRQKVRQEIADGDSPNWFDSEALRSCRADGE